MKYKSEYGKEMEGIILGALKNKKLLHELLIDFLSPAEYKELAIRWQITKQLYKNIPHRAISKNLGVSVATIVRGSRELLNKKGGFTIALEKFYKKKSSK
jgi:Trp operon repressor